MRLMQCITLNVVQTLELVTETTPEDNLTRRKVINTAGQPKSDKSENVFLELMKKIEDEHTQKSIPELVQEMQTLCGLEHAYSVVHMKKRCLLILEML